jgi:hypothetical protein
MKHYVYKLTEQITKEFYYGVRSFKGDPNKDSYMGSMKTWKPNKDNLIKEVVSIFDDRESALKFETNIIIENLKNPLNRNYHTGSGMSFYGKNHNNESRKKISTTLNGKHVGVDNPFYGKKHTSETIEKIKQASLGRIHSDESKTKMSKTALKLDRTEYNLNRKKVLHIETNVVYNSIYMAAKELGMCRTTIRKYMNDKFKLL